METFSVYQFKRRTEILKRKEAVCAERLVKIL
jgi:hypothetical protein